jgi:predicted aldo/keto reductase-like oxidoreductase
MINRRVFIKGAAASTLAFPATLSGLSRDLNSQLLEKRALGKTGEKLSVIGFGGIVVKNATSREASERVSAAVETGVNYFDVAPTYGNAEDMLGPALEPYRKDVFLACKTAERKAAEALEELESSLKKMRTDHFDLYQLHAVTKLQDVETILGPGGALETFLKARDDGKIRFIGFSAHSVEAAQALIGSFDFDTILFPVNFRTWYVGNFGPQVLEMAKDKGMGILALKAMADKPWADRSNRTRTKTWYEPLLTPEDAGLALNFTLSHPVTAAIPPGDEQLFAMALQLALKFSPLSEAQTMSIKQMAQKGEPIFRYPSPSA